MRTIFLSIIILIGCENPKIMEEVKSPRKADISVFPTNGATELKGDLEIQLPNQDKTVILLTGKRDYTTQIMLNDGQGASIKVLHADNMITIHYQGYLIKTGRQLSLDFEELE